jgi:hypothetical protein
MIAFQRFLTFDEQIPRSLMPSRTGNDVDRINKDDVARMNAAKLGDINLEMIKVTFSVSVHDQSMLWDAAVMKASAASLRVKDIIDVIGPREDPCLIGCITFLTQPADITGCELEDFDVEPAIFAQVYTYPQGLIAA